ncbi:unnamed protein product [Zymoseptoria tritici ST99CH_3D7]|uniref:C3H1-type domain-containing protein n=1 Tax=Zymoseptoria tritici (strain ST99CH_3D7) TaxID=1276538 RepID=A0A1X7S8P5_ZYMT9|nr:unnamed protein product [Zymoseptoria tritici ST99CH_3D7]
MLVVNSRFFINQHHKMSNRKREGGVDDDGGGDAAREMRAVDEEEYSQMLRTVLEKTKALCIEREELIVWLEQHGIPVPARLTQEELDATLADLSRFADGEKVEAFGIVPAASAAEPNSAPTVMSKIVEKEVSAPKTAVTSTTNVVKSCPSYWIWGECQMKQPCKMSHDVLKLDLMQSKAYKEACRTGHMAAKTAMLLFDMNEQFRECGFRKEVYKGALANASVASATSVSQHGSPEDALGESEKLSALQDWTSEWRKVWFVKMPERLKERVELVEQGYGPLPSEMAAACNWWMAKQKAETGIILLPDDDSAESSQNKGDGANIAYTKRD